MRRSFWWLVLALASCDPPAEGGGGTTASAAAHPVDVVVRSVDLQQTIKTPPVEKGGEEEEWTADEDKMYALVITEVAHNQCASGDKLDAGQATLALDGATLKAAGGGAKKEALCLQCEAKETLDCNTATRLQPFIFIFEVGAKVDITKATLTYRGREAAMTTAKVVDKRGNDPLDQEIAAKKARLTEMRKRLENTSNTSDGKVMLSEMDALQKEIDALEAKRK